MPPVPAARLLNAKLANGWTVTKQLPQVPGATGGTFSFGYVVTNDSGKTAFLKAIDFSQAFKSPDPARLLQVMSAAFNFERDLLQQCSKAHLDRVVLALDHGKIEIDPSNPIGIVQYLIFELADGDIRKHLKFSNDLDLGWTLKCLHNIAVGLNQLHGQNIAHQDLKPSNVMVFQGADSKIGDLGRAAAKGQLSPHEIFKVAGDRSYAPPELLYGLTSSDWNQRRIGCDAYLLGSMIVFFFTGASMTSLILTEMDPSLHWLVWNGTFADVLPFLRDAFVKAVLKFSACVNVEVREELTLAVRQLCDPDPDRRGHPKARSSIGNSYAVDRYVTQFDMLVHRIFGRKIKIARRTP